jgi:hypothetical protein
MNLIEVANEFATETQCLEFLSKWRWPDGVRCPVCGNDKVTRINRKTEGDNKRPFTFKLYHYGPDFELTFESERPTVEN